MIYFFLMAEKMIHQAGEVGLPSKTLLGPCYCSFWAVLMRVHDIRLQSRNRTPRNMYVGMFHLQKLKVEE